MATIEEINAEIARQERLAEIDAEIARREPTLGQQIVGGLETIGTLATSIPATIGGGVAGAATLLTGDPAAAEAVRKGVTERLTFEGGEESKRQLQQLGGLIQTVEQNVVRPALAGTAGLADIALNPLSNIAQGFQPAIETVRSVEEQGLARSAGFQALQETGSPLLATGIETAGTVLGEVFGGLVGRALGKARIAKSKVKTQEAQTVLDDLISGDVKESTVLSVSDTIKTGDADDIASIIDADPEFFRALDELNISSEPLASFSSRNPQFRDVEQALATVPGNILEPTAKTFIKEVSKKADDLIQQYGGTKDKAQLGLDFKKDSLRNVDDLFQQADDAYSALRRVIPEENRFPAPNSVAFLEDLARKDKLPSKFARILNQLKPRQVKTKGRTGVNPATGQRFDTGTTEIVNPKLGRIDLLRKEIGQATNKKSGPFKDVETGLNKALYARLTRDQDAIAQGVGGEALAISDMGKSLVRQRKQIEDNLQKLLGNDLNEALNVNVAGAIKGLEKGKIDKFNEIMDAIPKNKREEVALSAMNDVFKGAGVNQQSLNPTQFVKWFKTINRSPAAKKALFGALPKESRKAIENLFVVSNGISKALGQKVQTGRINALFNEETGFIRRMVGRAIPAAVAFVTKSPTASFIASNAAEQFIKQSTDGAKRASDLMASPNFQSIIRQAVKEGVVDGGKASRKLEAAEVKLAKTESFQKWAETLGQEDRAILAGGLLGYLFGQNIQDEQTNANR